MPNTYVALRTETVAVATSTVTISLSGISGYTDLVLVINAGSSAGADANFRLNGDSGSNYSRTLMTGNGSTATSSRTANAVVGRLNANAYPNGGAGDTTIIAHFMNYANTTTYKTVISRANNAGLGTDAVVNLWRNTAAITSIEILSTSAATYAVGSTFSLYGIANADQGAAKATGGIITEDSTYWYHTFGASGAFIPKQSLTCDVLVVAGGGGGGFNYGGGGGAGGLLAFTSQTVSTQQNIIVGAGGARSTTMGTRGSNGVDSQFASLTLVKGGGAGGAAEGSSQKTGVDGGSGGGGAGADGTQGYTGTNAGGSLTTGQGFAGGSGTGISGVGSAGGGGGGAGGAGANAVVTSPSTRNAGNGGVGVATYSSWSIPTGIGQNVAGTYYIAGGGGGGEYNTGVSGLGGLGGGAAGTAGGVALNAIANTGGGGGGSGSGTPSNGGSGVVIVRYAK
jgi:hypothetical protein